MVWRRTRILTGAVLLGFGPAASAQSGEWTGAWTGSFGTPGAELEIVLRLQPEASGWQGRLDIPAHGLFDAGTRVTLRGDSLRFEVGDLRATFAGVRAGAARRGVPGRGATAAPDTVSGLWRQDTGLAALRLVRTSREPGLRRPQEPVGAVPYREYEVRFTSLPGSVSIAGTLALPHGAGPHPAVVLISGSGPHERDGAMAGHRPFLVLSDELVRRGIAVLRYDERGVGGSTGDFAAATSVEFADDALAAVRFLQQHPDISANRVGLVGHSEGGMVAPIAANRGGGVAFLVLLAAPGLPMVEVSVQQSEAILRAEGRPEREVAASRRAAERLMQLAASTDDTDALARGARAILEESMAPLQLPPDVLEGQLRTGVSRFTSPWMQFAARHDPGRELQRIHDLPVLALNGSLDAQVAPGSNLAAIRDALLLAGNRRAHTAELPGLNHLFQTAHTGAPSEYGRITETFAPLALRMIGDWILDLYAVPRQSAL